MYLRFFYNEQGIYAFLFPSFENLWDKKVILSRVGSYLVSLIGNKDWALDLSTLATDRKTHFTKWCLCIWSGSARAFDWTESSWPEPRTKWSELSTAGNSKCSLSWSWHDKNSSKYLHKSLIAASWVLQVRHILNDKKRLRKIIDPDMSRNSYTMESIAMFASLASRCVRIDSTERPSMIECVKELQLIVYTNSKGLGMTLHTFRMI